MAKRRYKRGAERCRTAKYHVVKARLANPDIPESYVGVQDPVLKRIRAMAILKDRINGMSLQEVADKYRVGLVTVQRTLSWAKRASLLVEVEDMVLQDFVPEAATVLLQTIRAKTQPPVKDGDPVAPFVPLPTPEAVRVALEVWKGTGVLRKPGSKSPSNPVGDSGDDLAKHIQSLRARAALDEATHDGELLGTGESDSGRQLEAGAREPLGLPAGEAPSGGPPVDGADGQVATPAGEAVGSRDPEAGPVEP